MMTRHYICNKCDDTGRQPHSAPEVCGWIYCSCTKGKQLSEANGVVPLPLDMSLLEARRRGDDKQRDAIVPKAKRRIVYFAHPLRGKTADATEENRRLAGMRVAQEVVLAEKRGEPIAPVAAWIHLAEHWSEEEGRALGLIIDCALIEVCSELWLIGPKQGLSEGMLIEYQHALKHGIKIVDKRQ